jgi:hypothetical protein
LVERRKAMRFRTTIASQAMPEAKQHNLRLAALHHPSFLQGNVPKPNARNRAREQSRARC